MELGIIIQARMGSSRLPGKILRPFYKDKKLIDILLDNLHQIKDVKIIIATSEDNKNQPLVDYLEKRGELIFRGAENDVLDRFIKAAEKYNLDALIRICSDNPFLDVEGVKELIETAKKSDADYIGFRINNKPSIQTHFGFWGEFVRLEALKKVANNPESTDLDKEHVTYHIYNHQENFKCEWIPGPLYLQNRNDIRLTVDTIEDFNNAAKVYSELDMNNLPIILPNVINYLDSHIDIKESMLLNISKNSK